MDACLNCQKELQHVEGRRKKSFCSPTCRNAYWRKHAKKEPRYVLWETHQKVLNENKELKTKLSQLDLLKPEDVEKQVAAYGNESLGKIRDKMGAGVISSEQEQPAYDFTDKKWLNVEEYTKYPIKARPESKSERIEWDRLRREEHEQIKQAWANRNKH